MSSKSFAGNAGRVAVEQQVRLLLFRMETLELGRAPMSIDISRSLQISPTITYKTHVQVEGFCYWTRSIVFQAVGTHGSTQKAKIKTLDWDQCIAELIIN